MEMADRQQAAAPRARRNPAPSRVRGQTGRLSGTGSERPLRLAGGLLLLCLLLAPSPPRAQPIEEKRVAFASGSSSTLIRAGIRGREITDYLLGARAGQVMTIDFAAENPAANFNLMIGSDPAAIHIGPVAGNRFSGTLPADGDYRIRVYLVRSAARRGENSGYTLSVSIGSLPQPASGDADDGRAGGPDWWAVTGLSAGGMLALLERPGTGHAVTGEIADGARALNRGCRMAGETRWCRIELPGTEPLSGWVPGRYLAEAPGPEAGGTLPCALSQEAPLAECGFRVSHGAGGTASLWIALPGGGERYLEFRDGRLAGSDPGATAGLERGGGLATVTVNRAERYEIPDAVLFGVTPPRATEAPGP
ncbi:hypothetical protein [Poseidonocella sp. HB161398]|uniref:SH3 domain-containing protein n=1 Tax=Poseidonocella sp. HB161398 TaxID=2320855 RepID=UPI0014875564|nr:hypothetical protein [Poseidonocella sp. HB161398]